MEVKKSHSLTSASRRIGKTSGIIESVWSVCVVGNGGPSVSPVVQRPKNQDLWCPREGRHPSLRREGQGFVFPSPFSAPFSPSADWMLPTHPSEGGPPSPSLLNQILILPETPLWTTPINNTLPATWAFFSPVMLTHKISYHVACVGNWWPFVSH